MNVSRHARAGRWCAVAASVTTCAAIATTVSLAEPKRLPLVFVLVGALLWGLGGAFAVALIPAGHGGVAHNDRVDQSDGDLTDSHGIGTLMYLGRVPDQVARMTSAIATTSGPVCLVVPSGRAAPVGLDPAVIVVESDWPDVDEALSAFYERCDAVLVVSARAFPTSGCVEAARLLALGASWVQGRSEPLNRDRFGPMGRESLDADLRARATAAGLWCWQPDATILSTSLLRAHPLEPGRPLGTWLRERAYEGASGVSIDAALTRRATPVAADGYWPDTTARQCAGAADLSTAAGSGLCSARARAVAAGLLVRALSGWSVLWWLAVLVLLADGSPVRCGGRVLAGLVLGAVVLRWLAPRLATNDRPSPVSDMVAGLYALPGSLAATVSTVTRRVRPPRRAVPTRPLVWLALVALAAAASVVLTAELGDSAAHVAAGVAAALLVITWVFTVRSLVERSWRRVGFRIPMDLPANVLSERDPSASPEWSVVDGGSGGFAFVGPATGHALGDEVAVQIYDPDGQILTLHGTVAGIRSDFHGGELVGVELRAVEPGSAAWAQVLIEAAAVTSPAAIATPVDEDVERDSWGHRIDRLAVGLVLAASMFVAVALLLVLVGLRPLVIRSGSMEPTYNVGDIVLVAPEQAGDIRERQVVTRFDAPEAMDSLTHRVRKVTLAGDEVEVETRGDANETSETWSVPAEQQVGVVVASVPAIGMPLTAVRGSTSWAVGLGLPVLVVIAILLRPRRRQNGRRPRSGESLTSSDELPTTPAMNTIGVRK
ncbi:MAG TPA: signal peptidase I [Microthrixaceae bacterium]|nr:signal peptidase I [Microthrixaceae bacterium]